MCWVELKAIWKCKNLVMDRLVEGFGISFLEVSATTTPDEQCIASEGYALLVTHKCHTTCEQM
jgi:hypothetical protein